MAKVAITFLEHLGQLSVAAILQDPCEKSNIFVNKDGNIVVGDFELKILPENCLLFNSWIQSLSIKENDGNYEVDFDIECSPSKSLAAFDKNSCSFPPSEIVNDWIFCHPHGHCHEELCADHEVSRKLETLDQIRYLLSSKKVFEKVLIESPVTKEHIFFEIIDPELGIGSKPDLTKDRPNEIKLRKASVLDYKHLTWETDQGEIKEFRACFLTDWYTLDQPLLSHLDRTLQRNDLAALRLDSPDKPGFKQAFL